MQKFWQPSQSEIRSIEMAGARLRQSFSGNGATGAEILKQGGAKPMIFGAHVIVYSKDATADRAFFRDVLGFASVDAGDGWLIFRLATGRSGGSSRRKE